MGDKWFWLLVAVGVVWYLSKREAVSTKIAANRQATQAIDHTGQAVNHLIDAGASALGKWLSSSGSSSSGSSAAYTGDTDSWLSGFDEV